MRWSPTGCSPTQWPIRGSSEWKALHLEHLKTIEDSFAPLPVLTVELAPDELVGVDALRGFGRTASTATSTPPPSCTRASRSRSPGGARAPPCRSSCPSPTATSWSWAVAGDELLVRVGPYRRAITLPDSLRNRRVADATLKQGRLRVSFEGGVDDDRVTEDDDAIQQGLEHLQAAAREMIQATRSLLDAAEELVDDPKAVQGLVGTLRPWPRRPASRLPHADRRRRGRRRRPRAAHQGLLSRECGCCSSPPGPKGCSTCTRTSPW